MLKTRMVEKLQIQNVNMNNAITADITLCFQNYSEIATYFLIDIKMLRKIVISSKTKI
jgi:hypothetical protein